MRTITFFALIIAMCGCAATPGTVRDSRTGEIWETRDTRTKVQVAAITGPCNDAQYMRLLDVPIEEMTEREYEYFMLKEKQCQEWVQQARSLDQSRNTKNQWIGVVLAVFVGIPLLVAAAG